jgi:hypothetical protein
MDRILHSIGLALLAASCAWASAVPGAEQKPATSPDDPMREIGTLTCTLLGEGDAGASSVTGSGAGREMQCRFQVGTLGPEETYTGTVQGVGKAELLFGTGAVLLAVKAPQSTGPVPGLLAQTYAVDAGASANAFAPLVGDKKRTIVLQPLAEKEGRVKEGKMQPEAVIILVELRLQSSPA